MILDSRLEFCDATALSVASSSASVLLGNVIDTRVAAGAIVGSNTLMNLGGGRPLYWVITVDTAVVAASGSTGTTTFNLASDSTADIATSRTNHITTPAFTEAQLVAGFSWNAPLPFDATYERYLGTWSTQATDTITSGKINSFLTYNPPVATQYIDGI